MILEFPIYNLFLTFNLSNLSQYQLSSFDLIKTSWSPLPFPSSKSSPAWTSIIVADVIIIIKPPTIFGGGNDSSMWPRACRPTYYIHYVTWTYQRMHFCKMIWKHNLNSRLLTNGWQKNSSFLVLNLYLSSTHLVY
jgi:hypothetical protein